MNTAPYLLRLAERLASGLSALEGERRTRHREFILSCQMPDGGFRGREGDSDLYYTSFAVRGLAMLDGSLATATAQHVTGYLAGFDLERLSIVDLVSWLNTSLIVQLSGGGDPLADSAADWSGRVAARLESVCAGDGGYAKSPEGAAGSTYHSFLVALCYELIGRNVPRPNALIQFVYDRQRDDGGFVEIAPMKRSGTNPTAAAVALLNKLGGMDDELRADVREFLRSVRSDEGGFQANSRIPFADGLSTFTGLLTCQDLQLGDVLDPARVEAFVRGQLEFPTGGFRGASWDAQADVEYTFYGLGVLALLGSGAGFQPARPSHKRRAGWKPAPRARDDTEGRPGSLRARWIFPGDGPPIENGTIVLDGGRIGEIHTASDPGALDLGNAAVIPGLVNAHTHLEFSDLAEPLRPARPFAEWIRSVVAHRRGRPSAVEPVGRGAIESVCAGTTLLGDILTDDRIPDAYPADGPRVVAFRELIGLLPEQVDERLAVARGFLDAAGKSEARVRAALSPHAPYSVHPELYRRLVELAAERNLPLAVHLAETQSELELLRNGTGELVEMLRDFGVWRDGALPRGGRPLDFLRPLIAVERALAIHGNYLDPQELAFLADHPHITVVYCPRTHAYFGHGEHPWRELLARGGSVALGTDSRASNLDLSVFEELRFLRGRFPEVDPQVLLRLGTLAGAQALGFGEVAGSLTPGKAADVCVVALPEGGRGVAFDLLFDAGSRVAGVMRDGRWMHVASRSATAENAESAEG